MMEKYVQNSHRSIDISKVALDLQQCIIGKVKKMATQGSRVLLLTGEKKSTAIGESSLYEVVRMHKHLPRCMARRIMMTPPLQGKGNPAAIESSVSLAT